VFYREEENTGNEEQQSRHGIDAQTRMMASHIKLLKSTLLHHHQFKYGWNA
jgi:hypothetical protein